MNRLKSFLNSVPRWDLTSSSGSNIRDSARYHVFRSVDTCWFKETLHTGVIKRLCEMLDQFGTEANIDLLASGILDTIHIKDLLLRSDLHTVILPWVFSFRHFFLAKVHQDYWPFVISNLLQQYGQNLTKEFETDMAVPNPSCPIA